MKRNFILPAVIALIATALACNLPTATVQPRQIAPQASTTETTATIAAPASTPSPTLSPTPSITHAITPADINPTGSLNYDVDSSGTAPQHRAPYGDSYNINLFERPFTQKDMNYISSLDIDTFQLSSDDTWYYIYITLIGDNPNDPANIDYGVELDKDHDGFGDVLVWAQPPYTTNWTTNGVRVFTDVNHDTGGASPEKSDANATTSAPYTGDGYETIIFDQGQGDDPDLAWVRIDPMNPNVVDFAFKQSLGGTFFMWGVWADAGLKNPGMFNYNDRFTNAQAGSPLDNNQYYPIKAIYAVDNTCRAAYNFKPSADTPLLCPTTTAPAAPATKATQPPSIKLPPPVINICAINPSAPGCPPVIH
jgi:hypothetical protein